MSRVAVVGLGLAGLRAAVLLTRAGLDVSAFEARPRAGGRAFTVDAGGGVVYEAGAEWIDADHARIRALLAEAGEPAVAADNDPELFVFQGERAFADRLWPDVIEADQRLDAAARALIAQLPDGAEELDRRTLADLVATIARGPRGRWWLSSTYRADEGEELDRVSLLGWLEGYKLYLERDGSEVCAFRSPRGLAAVCERLVAELRQPPHLGWELSGLAREPGAVRLSFAGGRERTFDRVVLALPPRIVRALTITPPLGAVQAGALAAIGTGRVVKLALEFDDVWWLREGWHGKMSCDLRLQQTWPAGLGAAPVLAIYACGEDAAWWSRQVEPAPLAVDMLASLFPAARRSFVRGWRHDWSTDLHTCGGFSHLAPGFASRHLLGIRSPDDRIHFAGEHTAVWSGFLEGALESAERVASEVLSGQT